jgi:hypothetical protein
MNLVIYLKKLDWAVVADVPRVAFFIEDCGVA